MPPGWGNSCLKLYKGFPNYRKKNLIKFNQYTYTFPAPTDNKPLVELFNEMWGGVSHGICSAGPLVLNVAVQIWDNQLGRVSVCQHRCPQSNADNHQALWNFQGRLHYSRDTPDLPSGKVSEIRKVKGSYTFLVQQHIFQAIHNLERVRVMHWALHAYCRTQEQCSPLQPPPPHYEIKTTAWYKIHPGTYYKIFPHELHIVTVCQWGINSGISDISRHFLSHSFPGKTSSFMDM